LRPKQAIQVGRVGTQLKRQGIGRFRPVVVEVIEYGQFSPSKEDLAAPAAEYEVHDLIGCGVHHSLLLACPFDCES
jgi:hypothetical protein